MNADRIYSEIKEIKRALRHIKTNHDKSTRKSNSSEALNNIWKGEFRKRFYRTLCIEAAGVNVVFTLNYLMKLDKKEAIKLLPLDRLEYVQLQRIVNTPTLIKFHRLNLPGNKWESPYTFYHLGKKAWLIAKIQDNRLLLYFTGKNVVKYYVEFAKSYKSYFASRNVTYTFDTESCLWKTNHGVNKEDGVRKYVLNGEEIKNTIKELGNFIEVAKKLFREFEVVKSTGLLLYGPPGSGKTTLIKYIGRQLQLPLYYASPEDVKSIIDAEEEGYRNGAPRIIVFEDIDVVCDTRDGDEEAKRRFNLMLQYLDGAYTPPNVIFIATTNYPEKLDVALTRNGRFGRKIEVKYFDEKTALKYCKLNNLPKSTLDGVSYPVSPAFLEEKLIDSYYNKYLKESED